MVHSSCGQAQRRVPKLIVMPLVPPALPAAYTDETELHQHPVGGDVRSIGTGDNAGEAEFVEPILDKCSPGLAGKTSPPVGTGQVIRQCTLPRNQDVIL